MFTTMPLASFKKIVYLIRYSLLSFSTILFISINAETLKMNTWLVNCLQSKFIHWDFSSIFLCFLSIPLHHHKYTHTLTQNIHIPSESILQKKPPPLPRKLFLIAYVSSDMCFGVTRLSDLTSTLAPPLQNQMPLGKLQKLSEAQFSSR